MQFFHKIKHLFLIIGLLFISCNMKGRFIAEENAMKFIEVENAMKILTQSEKSIGYDISECNLLLSDSLRGYFIFNLEKSYQSIETLMNNPDIKLKGCREFSMSDVQIPILKHKNKVLVKGYYSDKKSYSIDYAYILELIEPNKLRVEVVYETNASLTQTTPQPITKEDSTEITIPEFDDEDLGKFIQQNINYPESAKKDSIRGSVVVSFWVETDLTTSGYEIVKSISKDIDKKVREDFDNEALRVAKLIPFKNPAFQYGEPVRYKVTIPINFKL